MLAMVVGGFVYVVRVHQKSRDWGGNGREARRKSTEGYISDQGFGE